MLNSKALCTEKQCFHAVYNAQVFLLVPFTCCVVNQLNGCASIFKQTFFFFCF